MQCSYSTLRDVTKNTISFKCLLHTLGAFLWYYPDQDHQSEITWIMVDQWSNESLFRVDSSAHYFDLPWSEWSRITYPDPDHLKGMHPFILVIDMFWTPTCDLNVCLSFVIKIKVRQKWGIHYWKFQNFQSFVWRNVWVPGWHQLGDLAWVRFACLVFLLFQPVFCLFPTAEPCSRLWATVHSTVDSTTFILLHRWVILRAPNDQMLKKKHVRHVSSSFFYDLEACLQ